MTAHARCVGPDNTLVEAAGLMRELDVGALPVCEGDRLEGIVTDRDIVLRATADGRDPNSMLVREVMSHSIVHIFADQEVEEAVHLMEDCQVRRLPVLSRAKRLVGIVSLGDIATSSNPAFSGMALRDVSQPRQPTARQRRLTQRSATAILPVVSVTRQRSRVSAQKKSSRVAKEGGLRKTSRRSATQKKSSSSPRRKSAARAAS